MIGKDETRMKASDNNQDKQAGSDNTVKKRGRPAGSKNKTKISRPDKQITTEPGENSKFINHDMKLMVLPDIDVNNPLLVKQRIMDYFRICAEDDIKPSVASFAIAFGIGRATLFNWMTGKTGTITNSKSLDTLKKAYDTINSYYEHMMNNGKINPVAGIFLMKNNMGYKDTTDYVISSNNDTTPVLSDITSRANLLDE